MYHVLIFEFLKHWAFSVSFGSTGAGFESRMQEIRSGGGWVARYAGVTGGCGRSDPFSWLFARLSCGAEREMPDCRFPHQS